MPDEASIRRDNPKVGDGERAALLAFWNAVKQPGEELHSWLEGDTGKAEWNTLCSRVGAARAAWLAAAFVPRLEGDAVALDIVEQERDLPNRVGGLPPVLDVWVMADDTPVGPQQVLVGQLKIAEDALRDQALELPLPDSIDSVKQSWWASWEKAQASGLGGIWDLPEGISPENIGALYVVGIGEEDPRRAISGAGRCRGTWPAAAGSTHQYGGGRAPGGPGQRQRDLAGGGGQPHFGGQRAACNKARNGGEEHCAAAAGRCRRPAVLPRSRRPRRYRAEPGDGAGPMAGLVGTLAARRVAGRRRGAPYGVMGHALPAARGAAGAAAYQRAALRPAANHGTYPVGGRAA